MMNFITKNKRLQKAGIKLIVFFIWVGLWQWTAVRVNQEILFVSPFDVISTLGSLSKKAIFWESVFGSLTRILVGYFAAVIIGTVLAVISSLWWGLEEFFTPIIHILKATPVASFIILALVWLKGYQVPVAAVFIMVTPVIWGNLLEAIRQTDRKLLEMGKVYGFSFWKQVRLIYIPSIMPYFLSACQTSMGLAWKSGIAAEVIATPRFSIGGQLYNAKIYLETAELFAWTAVVILFSVVLERVIVYAIRRSQGLRVARP